MAVNSNLCKLREIMRKDNLSATVIPTSDPHNSEYVCGHFKAREYFSGFTGSAGTLAVTADRVALWTDSRYFIQAEMQLKDTGIELMKIGEAETPTINKWLCANVGQGEKIGIPSELFTVEMMTRFKSSLKGYTIDVSADFIEEAWLSRPQMPQMKAFIHEDRYAGETVKSKIDRVRKVLDRVNCDMMIITELDEIAWLFNIRGNDVEYNPVVYSYAVVDKDDCILFLDQEKRTDEINAEFGRNYVSLFNYDKFYDYLNGLRCKKILIDEKRTNANVLESIVKMNKVFYMPSPINQMKAVKNETQIEGTRRAMVKDGVALVKFWMWIEKALDSGVAVTEISAADMLRHFRAEQDDFAGESFAPIVGYGEHGAIVHYSATEETNVEIRKGNLLLIDSGAHFPYGTTDITRTFALGNVTDEMKRDFTLVLKGHIALASAVFPLGTAGCNLDVLAKQYLWKDCKTFGHGTGHGVGHYLCVHEGPQNISPKINSATLIAGMITSNEPGYYREGHYGIRHENLTLTTECGDGFLRFETLTLFPFDLNGIDYALLSNDEKRWLNDYHETVLERLAPQLNEEERLWLENKCRKI